MLFARIMHWRERRSCRRRNRLILPFLHITISYVSGSRR